MPILMEVSGLSKTWNTAAGEIRALDQIGFRLRPCHTLGVVGESGSGKSTLARCLLRLIEPDQGWIRFMGEDLTYLTQADFRPYRQLMQMVFQNPLSSFDPRRSVGESLMEPLEIWELGEVPERWNLVREWVDRVGVRGRSLQDYPSQFSGGQLQRLSLARALILNPKLLICDEVLASLDVSVQAQMVDLMRSLQEQLHFGMIFIGHDLNVVQKLCDEVMVLHQGRCVEMAVVDEVMKYPRHFHTRDLLSCRTQLPSLEALRSRMATKNNR